MTDARKNALDEMPREDYENLTDVLDWWENHYPAIRVALTSPAPMPIPPENKHLADEMVMAYIDGREGRQVTNYGIHPSDLRGMKNVLAYLVKNGYFASTAMGVENERLRVALDQLQDEADDMNKHLIEWEIAEGLSPETEFRRAKLLKCAIQARQALTQPGEKS